MERDTHSDARGRYGYGFAYNVKVYRPLPNVGGETEELRERAWESAQRDWWADAEQLAKAVGFSGVYSAGRSGGYIVPYWNGQPAGPDLFGYYGDDAHGREFDAAMEERLQAFEAGIGEMMAEVPARFKAELEWLIERAAEEAKEAAEEARTRAETFEVAVGRLRADGLDAFADRLASYA